MNGFIEGMGKLNLFPQIQSYPNTSVKTAWQDVGRAFAQVGMHLKNAIEKDDAQKHK